MYRNRESIILASKSPRRQQFLMEMGLDFSIRSVFVDEVPTDQEIPEDFVRRMALEKAAAVSTVFPESWVISGDTIVCLENRILGKPVDKEDAVALLLQLSGREHRVKTGFCVAHGAREIKIVRSVITRVCFSDFSEEIARAYVATGESLDKAGAYGIQGRGGLLVKTITGSYSNVVGLPLHELMEVLENNRIVEPSVVDG